MLLLYEEKKLINPQYQNKTNSGNKNSNQCKQKNDRETNPIPFQIVKKQNNFPNSQINSPKIKMLLEKV